MLEEQRWSRLWMSTAWWILSARYCADSSTPATCRTPRHVSTPESGSARLRAHHASPTSAARLQTSGFRDIHPHLSLVGWHRSCVPSWMSAGYCRWPPSSAVCWQSNMVGQEITQPVWWPLFCHRRANAVEQFAWTASATGHHLRTIQTIVENVYVWLVGPWRPVSEC